MAIGNQVADVKHQRHGQAVNWPHQRDIHILPAAARFITYGQSANIRNQVNTLGWNAKYFHGTPMAILVKNQNAYQRKRKLNTENDRVHGYRRRRQCCFKYFGRLRELEKNTCQNNPITLPTRRFSKAGIGLRLRSRLDLRSEEHTCELQS